LVSQHEVLALAGKRWDLEFCISVHHRHYLFVSSSNHIECLQMIEQGTLACQPFLHLERKHIYNPLTDRTLNTKMPGYTEIRNLAHGQIALQDIDSALALQLKDQGWLCDPSQDQSQLYHLQFAEVEANTLCNQSCKFCPVSQQPRDRYSMTLDFFENIIQQLAVHRNTLKLVSLFRYNEPTVDKRLTEMVRIVRSYGLPPGMNTNATGLTPARVDELIEAGGFRFISINLSTLDRARYKEERGRDQLERVLRNIDYLRDKPLAERMDLAVLGQGDEQHRRDHERISERFADSCINVNRFEVMNRTGNSRIGKGIADVPHRLCGCNQTGSRPIQWIHITPQGKCVLCCQDYAESHVVGDLHEQTLHEVLSGKRIAMMRRWLYGLEEAPKSFICNRCIFARTKQW